jgi:hypothetical protein
MDRTTEPVDSGRGGRANGAIGIVAWGLTAFALSGRVLQRVATPDGGLVAVCQEVPAIDGPGYEIRLERPDQSVVRKLYAIGDGDPCTEVVWSSDGRILAVLSGHVARVRFVDVGWALDHPGIRTEYWSWRQVDLSNERLRVSGSGLRFVGPLSVEIQVCPVSALRTSPKASARRFEIPVPIVTAHKVRPG